MKVETNGTVHAQGTDARDAILAAGAFVSAEKEFTRVATRFEPVSSVLKRCEDKTSRLLRPARVAV